VEQVQIVSDLFDTFSTKDNFIVVDPVLGDNGKLYAGLTMKNVTEMRKLCGKADYIIPNMTEVSFLLNIPYPEVCSMRSAEEALRRLAELGCRIPLITGVRFSDSEQGAAAYDSEKDEFYYSFETNIDRNVHGTGDIFASVFTGAVTLGKPLQRSLDMAVKFTHDCIEATLPAFEKTWYGTCFENCLGKLIGYVQE
jgi:pyridoxine kinase